MVERPLTSRQRPGKSNRNQQPSPDAVLVSAHGSKRRGHASLERLTPEMINNEHVDPLPGAVGQAVEAVDADSVTMLPLTAEDALRPAHATFGVDIRLYPVVIAGYMQDRYDLAVLGFAIAQEPIEAVSLLMDGAVVSVEAYPHAVDGKKVFRLGLAQRSALAHPSVALEIAVKVYGGEEHRAAFIIARDEDDPGIAHVTAGPMSEDPMPVSTLAAILLYVEAATIDRQHVLTVAGWAVAQMQIAGVRVFIGEERIGSARFGQLRDDIASAYPGYPNCRQSGFSMSAQLSGEELPEAVTVEAIDLGGLVHRVVVPVKGDVTTIVPPASAAPWRPQVSFTPDSRRAIFLHCDQTMVSTDGNIVVSGWVVCATGIANVAINLDGALVGDADVGIARPDVSEQYRAIPQARFSGFRLSGRVGGPLTGEHLVTIVARNGLDDIRTLSRATAATEPEAFELEPAFAPADPDHFRFQLDNPMVVGGSVPDTIIGRLVIEGWALARSGVQAIEILLDSRSLGHAYYGTARRDVESAFPDWAGSLRSGYVFHFPPRALEAGTHVVRVRLQAGNGSTFDHDFKINVQPTQDAEDYATIRRRVSRTEIALYQDIADRLACRPLFRLIMCARKSVQLEKFRTTFRALANQAYADWHIVVLADTGAAARLQKIAAEESLANQISFVTATAALSAPIDPVAKDRPCLIGILVPGDELGADGLAEFAVARGLHPEAQIFYADEDRVSPVTHLREPFFKPDWSPDLLLATNYIGRPWFAAAELLVTAGVTLATLSQPEGDYDAVLRCTELATGIQHVPKLLCRRDEAAAVNTAAEKRMLQAAVMRRGIAAELLPGCVSGSWRLKRTAPATGKVSIIIPTCASQGHIDKCLETLRANTAYRNFEIICIDNVPANMPEWKERIRFGADKVVEIAEAFNWSRFNNRAAERADGEYLLFLNDDIEVQRDDWLDALLEHAQRPEVGIVGAQLLYPDGQVQHAGIFLTKLGAGRHSFRFLAGDDPGYFGLALSQRNVIAVTGACMLMRRDVFEQIGGFDEAHEVINNDVDCCLRAWRAGFTVVYTPYAQLIHHELASRAKIKDMFDVGHFAKQWHTVYASGDPFFSPRLTKFADEYRPDTEPARLICANRSLFRVAEIQRILVMKLDHIGDLLTALPALRRLRQRFPKARIHLLARGAAKVFLETEACVDELIEFEFFHARSDHGEKGVTDDDMSVLGQRLKPYRFDLAIDLRKQTDTRHILKCIPARFRAGYNYAGRFPWLDVALEWEGDIQLRRKASHVSEDLVRLIEVVAAAGDTEAADLSSSSSLHGTSPADLPAALKALFQKPVVAVHPGVGAVMRQWPPEYFAAVIDLLIEKNQVNVVVIGHSDEAGLADEVVRAVVNQQHVVSLAGRTTLSELSRILQSCALYLGNNSGPKHIAAALGVPTIGIHSGVVDAAEWAPMGPHAAAVQKNMVCSPCYLVKPEDCIRDIACLKRLEPAVIHQYCEMMLARVVPAQPRVGLGVKLADPTNPAKTSAATSRDVVPAARSAPGSSVETPRATARRSAQGHSRQPVISSGRRLRP